jgi:gluconate 5-dehydrogenase
MSTDLFDLTGTTALVTGSGGGLGLAIATGLARAGAAIVLNGRNVDKLQSAAETLRRDELTVHTAAFDVTDEQAVAEGLDRIETDFAPLDILVNNAGVQKRHPLEQFPVDDWQMVLDTNLTGPFICGREAARRMIPRKAGKIIHICSLMSEVGRPTIGAYSASKGGLKMLTRQMALEWGKHNIQVNGIGPGYFATEMTQSLRDDPEFNGWICGRAPMGRWGEPGELIGPAVFLASRASSFVTGQVLYVDGGILSTL